LDLRSGRAVDGILFDKDGTLFDFQNSWGAWASVLIADLAANDAHALRLAQALKFDPDRRTFSAGSPVIAGTAKDIVAVLAPFVPALDPRALEDRINRLAASAPMAEVVPLRPYLARLRQRGLALGLATNDSEVPARAHLDAHRITDQFDFIAGYDSGHGSKPKPGMCLAFAQAVSLAPDRCVMVGDSRHDLEAGAAAGMRCVGVLTGVAERADLTGLADVVLDHIGLLPDWLDGL
jgi:phosphoglycolate phosphatase